MSYWATRGLRGSTFEEMLNMTNEQYRKEGLALIQKVPTPIKPIEIDQEKRTIRLAYFEQKSTVDYIGVMGGDPHLLRRQGMRQKEPALFQYPSASGGFYAGF